MHLLHVLPKKLYILFTSKKLYIYFQKNYIKNYEIFVKLYVQKVRLNFFS